MHSISALNDYEDEEGEPIKRDKVDMEYKKRAINAFESNPAWKFLTFQNKFKKVKHRNYLQRWKSQIRMGKL